MSNHPGIIDDADVPPTWTPLKRSSVKATPVEGSSALRLEIELNGESDPQWDRIFHQIAQEYIGHYVTIEPAGSRGGRSKIVLSIDEQFLERSVADADYAVTSTNTSFEQHVMSERLAAFEARQAAKSTLAERQASINERILHLNDPQ